MEPVDTRVHIDKRGRMVFENVTRECLEMLKALGIGDPSGRIAVTVVETVAQTEAGR